MLCGWTHRYLGKLAARPTVVQPQLWLLRYLGLTIVANWSLAASAAGTLVQ